MYLALPARLRPNPAHLPNTARTRLLLVRYWYEYRRLWKTIIFRDFLDRLLYLLAFGFGMGGIMSASHGGHYLAFLVPGIAASNGIFVMTMAMTFGVWERSQSQKLWQAWLATPIRLPDILAAELLYASLRAMPSILILYLLAATLGALPSVWGALASIPVLLLANLTFGALALCFTAHIRRTLHFAYVNTLWTTPMFLFSGVFFDMSHAPVPLQWLSQLSPLTHVLSLVRPLVLGEPISILTALMDITILLLLLAGAYSYARYRFTKRLFA